MSPRLKLRSAARPLVLASALWGGGPSAFAAPPVHVEDAMLKQPPPVAAQPAAAPQPAEAQRKTPPLGGSPAGKLGQPHDAPVPAAVVHHLPARPMPRQTPPPCAPDGVCIPNPATFGVYPTRWRTFPGDLPAGLPTEAVKEEQQPTPEQGLGGPQLPTLQQEGSIVPPRATTPEGAAAPGAEAGAEGSAEPVPGADGAAPPASGLAPEGGLPLGPEPGTITPPTSPLPGLDSAPAAQPAPGGPESGDPLDPFGGGPPTPPAWMSRAAAPKPAPVMPPQQVQHAASVGSQAAAQVTSPPQQVQPAAAEMEPGAKIVQPAGIAIPVLDGPNLHSEDAPPPLPSSLKRFSGVGVPSAAATLAPVVASDAPVVAGESGSASNLPVPFAPSTLATDRHVIPASAEHPVGIQLINPAAAVVVEPSAEGLQQAIYFEASDQE